MPLLKGGFCGKLRASFATNVNGEDIVEDGSERSELFRAPPQIPGQCIIVGPFRN